MHQSEVDEAASIKKAKVVHSQEVLDAKVDCTRSVLKAKSNYQDCCPRSQNDQGQSASEV